MIALDDHALQLQWDSSKIDKGFKDLERKFAKFGKMDIKTSVSPDMKRGGARGSASSISQGERDRGIANLDATTLKARQQIEALNKVGSKEARSKILALEAAVKRLKVAEDGLNKSTKTTDKSFIRYKKTLRDTKNQINSMSKSTNTLARKFTTAKFAASGLMSSLKNLGRSWISVFAIMAGVTAVKEVTKSFETVNATLLLASGNSKQAAKDLEFLKELSMRVGVSFLDSAKAFAKYAVAARGAGLTNVQMKESFEDLSIAIRATGLNQDDANLSFLALQQMLSNGVVSMEELRKQLSERMPQTMEVAKKALRNLGYEFTSLKEIISTGAIDSGPFVKELTRLMAEQAKETGAYGAQLKSITAQEARLGNALNFGIKDFSKSGFAKGYAKFLGTLSQTVRSLNPLFRMLGSAIGEILGELSLVLEILNAVAAPLLIIADSLMDINDILKGGFNKELEKGATTLNFFKRTWMVIAGLIGLSVAKVKLLFATFTDVFNKISESPDPFAFMPSNVKKEIGLTMDKVDVGLGNKTSSTKIDVANTYHISGDPDVVRATIDDAMGSYMQNAYSGGG